MGISFDEARMAAYRNFTGDVIFVGSHILGDAENFSRGKAKENSKLASYRLDVAIRKLHATLHTIDDLDPAVEQARKDADQKHKDELVRAEEYRSKLARLRAEYRDVAY